MSETSNRIARPVRRPSTARTNSEDSPSRPPPRRQPKAPLPVLSQTFIDRYLWPPYSADSSVLQDHPSSYTFDDNLISRIQASFSYAFYCASTKLRCSTTGVRDTQVEQTVTLYCPLPCGHAIVDSMVKLVAGRLKSEVLELDALELVAGPFGAMGDAGDALHLLYNDVNEDFEYPAVDIIYQFFKALIIARRTNEGEGHSTQPSRRVIYLKDIGSIASSVPQLVSFILHVIRDLRQEGTNTNHVIILVLGVTAAPRAEKLSNQGGNMIYSFPCCNSFDTVSSNVSLNSLLEVRPEGTISSDSWSDPDPIAPGHLSPLFIVANKSWKSPPTHYLPDSDWEKFDAVADQSNVLRIQPKDMAALAVRNLHQHATTERVKHINITLMRKCMGSRGGHLSSDAEASWAAHVSSNNKFEEDHFQLFILSHLAANTIASIAIGLSFSENFSAESVNPSPDHILQAYQLLFTISEDRTSDSSAPAIVSAEEQKPVVVDRVAEIIRHLPTTEEELVSCIIKPETLNKTAFGDVVIDPVVIETLRSIISLPLLHPHHFRAGLLATESLSGVLLYGPPGTGKTMVCRALAQEIHVPMLYVRASDIIRCYVGESETRVRAVFSLAQRLAPCVMFIDEADTLFGARKSRYKDDVLTEFMQAMDGLDSSGKDIVVIGATNRPYALDTAMHRRLPRRMMVDLPGNAEREQILRNCLRSETCSDDVDIHEIANNTDHYSGSDLKNLCVSAVLEAVNDSIPKLPSITQPNHSTAEGHSDVTNKEPLRVITMDHIRRAFDLVPPSFSPEAHAELYRWHEKHVSSSIGLDDAHPDKDSPEDENEQANHQLADFLSTMSAIQKAASKNTSGGGSG